MSRATRRDRLIGSVLLGLLAAAVLVGLWQISGQSDHARIAVVGRPERIMGTSCSLAAVVRRRDEAAARQALAEAEMLLRSIESRMSRWLNESEISRVNTASPKQPTPLSADTLMVLRASRDAYEQAGGVFDVTCGPLIALWNDAARRQTVPSDADIAAARSISRWDLVELRDTTAVRLAATVRIDLGGIAKGYAVDQALAVLRRAGFVGGLVDIGGDLACFGQPPQGHVWTIDVQNPFTAKPMAKLRLVGGAVCTSGNYARPRMIAGRAYSHIIDPRSGRPAEATPSVTVLAPTAIEADIWATALSVLGPDGFDQLPEPCEALMVVGTPARHEVICTPGMRDQMEYPLPEHLRVVEPTRPAMADSPEE